MSPSFKYWTPSGPWESKSANQKLTIQKVELLPPWRDALIDEISNLERKMPSQNARSVYELPGVMFFAACIKAISLSDLLHAAGGCDDHYH